MIALLGIAAVAAVLSNVVDDLPATLVLLPLVTASGPPAVLAMLVGVNIGPNLTYVGSLANLLWRSVVRRDIPIGFREFSRVGLVTTPVTMVVAVLGLSAGASKLSASSRTSYPPVIISIHRCGLEYRHLPDYGSSPAAAGSKACSIVRCPRSLTWRR